MCDEVTMMCDGSCGGRLACVQNKGWLKERCAFCMR